MFQPKFFLHPLPSQQFFQSGELHHQCIAHRSEPCPKLLLYRLHSRCFSKRLVHLVFLQNQNRLRVSCPFLKRLLEVLCFEQVFWLFLLLKQKLLAEFPQALFLPRHSCLFSKLLFFGKMLLLHQYLMFLKSAVLYFLFR